MNFAAALAGMTPGIHDGPGSTPDIELPELVEQEEPLGGFDPEPEVYEPSWDGHIQARAFVSAYRIGETVRQELGLPADGVIAIYEMRTMPEGVSAAFVTIDDAGWEGWQFLARPALEDGPPPVTAIVTTELYVGGLYDLFDPEEQWDRRALEHAMLVDVELVDEDIRSALAPDVAYVLAAPAHEAAQSGGDFESHGDWGLATARPSESPWGQFSHYATARPDQDASVGSASRMGERLYDGEVEMGDGWEIRVSWDQNSPWED